MLTDISQLNYALFQTLNIHAGQYPWLDALMVFSANNLIFGWFFFLLIAWGRPLLWRKDKSTLTSDKLSILQARRASVLWVAFACLLAYAFNLLVEQFVFEPRPFMSHHVHLLASHVADASFPSDHTAWSFAVVGIFLFSLSPWFAWLQPAKLRKNSAQNTPHHLDHFTIWLLLGALFIGCLIGVARIFIGVHYPDDILGGAFSGLLAAFIITYLRYWLHTLTNAILRFAERLHLA